MNKEKLGSNKGISMADVITAIIILCIFVGVIGNLYYQIVLHNQMIRLNTIAVYYVVKVAEDMDKISYEEVKEELNNNLKERYELPEAIKMSITVENYNETNPSKEDAIKIVKIKAEYKVFEDTRVYEVKKLKIKER